MGGAIPARELPAICKSAVSHLESGLPHHDGMNTERKVTKWVRGSRRIQPKVNGHRQPIAGQANPWVQSQASAC